jgi:hypothetical protein
MVNICPIAVRIASVRRFDAVERDTVESVRESSLSSVSVDLV